MKISCGSPGSDFNSYDKGREKKSPFIGAQKSPSMGPLSPPLMCQKSPTLVFHNSPSFCPQSPPFKSQAPLVLDPQESKLLGSTPSTLEPQTSDDDDHVAASEPSLRSLRKRGSRASLKFELSPNAASKVSPVKGDGDFVFIEDVHLASAEAEDSEQLQSLLCAVGNLWKEVKFGGECFDFMAKDSALKLTILARVEPSSDNPQKGSAGSISLVGFLVYKLHPNKKYLSVRRLAVSPALRRQGRARQLMNWCVRVPCVNYLALTSIPRALDFYRSFGFRKVDTWHTGGTAHPDDEPTIDEVYMEYRPGAHKGTQRRKARR